MRPIRDYVVVVLMGAMLAVVGCLFFSVASGKHSRADTRPAVREESSLAPKCECKECKCCKACPGKQAAVEARPLRPYYTDETVFVLDGQTVTAEKFNESERNVTGLEVESNGRIARLTGRTKKVK